MTFFSFTINNVCFKKKTQKVPLLIRICYEYLHLPFSLKISPTLIMLYP